MIYNPKYETMDRESMKKLQSERLIETVRYVYENVPFYRKKMDDMNITPSDIQGIDDLSKLPFTTKQDLRDNYPYDMFAVDMKEIVRIHASSGTTGKPTVVGYTKEDIEIWAEVMARTFGGCGVSNEDIFQNAYGYGLFTGGLGAHYGAEKIGCSVIPISGGNTEKQIQIMQDFKSTALACTPSYALYLAEYIEEMGIDRSKLHIKTGIFGAEPWTEQMRREIEERLQIKAYDIYGLSEIIGPGVSFNCEMKNGLHVNEDHFIPEILDVDTLAPLPYGKQGELAFTTITKKGLPILRYRTRDLTVLHNDICACGRTLVRMEKCTGRSDDMLIIRGVNLFPSQIESILLEISEVEPHYLLVVDRVKNMDVLEVWVEVLPEIISDEIKVLEALTRKIEFKIKSMIGVTAKVKLVEPKTIKRSEGKAQRVLDKRKGITQ